MSTRAPDVDYFRALFLLAGIEIVKMYELPNQYWPQAYPELRTAHPWQLVMTSVGPMKIGWRKRVISISWEDTAIRCVLTEDDVTKDETLVHAWSYQKALEYLTALGLQIRAQAPATQTSES